MTHPQVNAGNAADEGDAYDAPLGFDRSDDDFEADALEGDDEAFDDADAAYETEGYDEGDG